MPEKYERPPDLVASERVFEGPLFAVDRDQIRFADGHVATRDTIRHPGAVGMVPVEDDGTIWMVEQYRHAARARMLEIPAGTLEPGESPAVTAARELQEEIGKRARSIAPLGGFYVAPGYTSEYIHLFLCRDLEDSVLAGDDDEDITTTRLTVAEALAAVQDGRIVDAKTIIALYQYEAARDSGYANNQ